jgi:glycosidase
LRDALQHWRSRARFNLLGALAPFLCVVLQAAPEITKVEPPNWWVGHSVNPVRLLISGRNLTTESIRSKLPVTRARTNASGTYLFLDVTIPKNTRPGSYPITIGGTEAPFSITAHLPRGGRFQGFSPNDVFYLIMPDRFANGDPSNDSIVDPSNIRAYHGGDFQGIINRLPYLKDVGVTALWLNPVYNNTNADYHGYHAVDFYAVEDRFGTLDKFRELVDRAHAVGIKVIQDQVANHTGPKHPWAADPPTPSWFNGTVANHLRNPFQAWTLMDPNASPELRRSTLEGWFVNRLPDLNQNDEEVKRYIVQNTLWWIGMTGIDGIRQDTVAYVPRSFWPAWMASIKREYPAFRVVGEVLERDPVLVSFFQGGRRQFDGIDTAIDSVFDFPLYFAIREVFGGSKPLRDLATVLAHDALYADASTLVTHLGLHDVPRFLNEPSATPERLKLAYTFLMTTRGTPLIYYGDEVGLRGGGDPDNRRDFPDPPPDSTILNHVRALTRLRSELEPLRTGKLVNVFVSNQQYVYLRQTRQRSVVVAINNADTAADVHFAAPDLRDAMDRLGSGVELTKEGRIAMPARSAVVFDLGLR